MNANERPIELEEFIDEACADGGREQLKWRLDALLWKEAHPLRSFWRDYFARIRRFRFDQ